jgi:threonine/homoserine/homoserine lactone efflux protein
MTPDTALALAGFALVTSVTPGPNNLMLMASGVNFGLRRTVPHMLGVALGFVAMTAAVGLGVMAVFEALPWLERVLRVASVGYLLWLAWKVALAAPPEGRAAGAQPLTFLQAAAFQWVNPKAWAMALTAIGLYAPDRDLWGVLAVAVLFGAVNLPSVGLWAAAGTQLRRWLSSPARLRAFNWTCATALVASMLPFVL